MACNLAVSITKAAVTEEKMRALLAPEKVQPVVEAYLRQPGVLKQGETFAVNRQGSSVVVVVAGLRIFINGGRVSTSATAGYNDARGRELVDALSNLLALTADALFAQQVKAALAPLGKVKQQQVSVDNGGVTQAAMVFTLNI